MTIAIDRKTGKPIGQVIDRQPGVLDDKGRIVSAVPQLLLLDRDGYFTVSAWSVKVEEV